MAEELASLTEIREILAGEGRPPFSKETISAFVKEGMPKSGRGTYPVLRCLRWYVNRLRSSVQHRARETEDGEIVRLDEAERRLKLARAESEEMTLAERRKELMPVHLYEEMLTHLIQVTKQRFLNMPARLAAKLEGCTTAEIKALLSGSIRDALSELARKESENVKRRSDGARKPLIRAAKSIQRATKVRKGRKKSVERR